MPVRLPILTLGVREQRYSCHGCGNCCRDFTVQLREEDLRKLRAQRWEAVLGGPVTVEFRGSSYLRQREDGSCIFLLENGLCRIHAEHGFEAKPIACQLFPFHLAPAPGGVAMGLSFACQSVLENMGAELKSHQAELQRMAAELPEVVAGVAVAPLPRLTSHLRARAGEAESAAAHLDRWLRRSDLSLPVRLDGLAWVVQSLAKARLENVRGDRFNDLLDVLFGALPGELEHHPVDPGGPAPRQRAMLRQAVFTRIEDPKIGQIAQRGRLRIILGQLQRSRRFKRGRGIMPRIGLEWPVTNVLGEDVERVGPAVDTGESAAIENLVARWLRATVLGHRAWGAGYYGWPIVSGLQAMMLSAACLGWLARLHAAGRGLDRVDVIAVRAALGRVDRSSGRARWLGSRLERLRLRFLAADDGLRQLLRAYRLTGPSFTSTAMDG